MAADPTSAIDSWGAVSAGTHVTCGIVGAQRRLKCWGKALDYAPGSEYAAAFDDSCKELEPQGSTNPRSGVRRNLLADIRRHQSKNAVHQAPIG